MTSHGAHPTPSPAAPAADAVAAEASSVVSVPSVVQSSSDPRPQSPYTTEEQFAIALNIARMEALDTLLAAAAIRDDRGNPTREAIFAANRVLAFTIHHDRLAAGRAAAAGAGPSPNLPQGGGPAAGGGGGSGIPTASPSSSFSSSPSSYSPRIDIQLDIRPPSPRPTPPASTLTKLPHGESVEQAKRRETEGAPAFSSPSTSPPPLTSDIRPPTSDIAVGATSSSPPPSSPTPSPTQSLVTDTISKSAIPTSELRIPHSPDLTAIAEQAINCLREELNLSDAQVAALRADPVAWLNEHLPEYMTDDPPDEITALEAALLTGTADDG